MTAADFFATDDHHNHCSFNHALTQLQFDCVKQQKISSNIIQQLEQLADNRYFPAVVVLFSLFRETAVHSAGINFNAGLVKDDDRAYGYVVKWMLNQDEPVSYQNYLEQLLRQLITHQGKQTATHTYIAKCRSAASRMHRVSDQDQTVVRFKTKLERLLDDLNSMAPISPETSFALAGNC